MAKRGMSLRCGSACAPMRPAPLPRFCRAGIEVEILSGDREPAVRHAAATLGIHEWRAGVTPADKIARIEELKRQGVKVMMVGDGMNDAPALAAAHVSMSPVSATHLSQATADLVFLGDRLAPVVAAIGFSRKALRLMRQNLWLAAGYNLLAVPLAIAGLGDAAGRRRRDVGFVAAGDPERAARPSRHEGVRLMEVLVFLVPLALTLGAIGLMGFLWSLKNGQYDDLEGAGWRAIADDEPVPQNYSPGQGPDTARAP